MKLVGVISDTRVPARAKKISEKVCEVFRGVNLIIHAGDLTHLSLLKELERPAPVVAVYGNVSKAEVQAELPEVNYVEVFGWKIGVMHNPEAL